MIPWLETKEQFPDTAMAMSEPNGLLAAGGELSPEWLIHAYKSGIFPWYSEDDPILWWSPSPRCILRPSNIHISRSMRRLLNKQKFKCTANTAFNQVINLCATTRVNDGTWIQPEIIEAYQSMHNLNIAHSIEVWQHGQLVGGMYGIQLGSIFFGESMFSLTPNASKIACIALSKALEKADFAAIDCQVGSDHLYSMGAEDISRQDFQHILNHCNTQPSLNPWHIINSGRDELLASKENFFY
jgi:leucyl/phenylalanyl-tRNA--protein transferase